MRICDRCRAKIEHSDSTHVEFWHPTGAALKWSTPLDLCDACAPVLSRYMSSAIQSFIQQQDKDKETCDDR